MVGKGKGSNQGYDHEDWKTWDVGSTEVIADTLNILPKRIIQESSDMNGLDILVKKQDRVDNYK